MIPEFSVSKESVIRNVNTKLKAILIAFPDIIVK